MTLLAPSRLWLLIAVAALALAYVVLQRRRRHYAVRFTNIDLLDSVAPRRPGWRRHVVAIAALVGLSTMVVSLARPVREERVPRGDGIVMLTIDVSASMTATDVAPSRIAAAKAAAKDFVDRTPAGFQIGLVAFDANARVLQTPTDDHDAVTSAIDTLEPGEGTAAGEGIYAALDAIKAAVNSTAQPAQQRSGNEEDLAATIVLLSDGTTTTGRPVDQAAQAAKDASVPVNTIAFGTDSGTVVIQGEVIPVPADRTTMESVARTTDGSAFSAGSAAELKSVYEDIQGRVGYTTETREIGRWFVAGAMVLLLLAIGASMYWTARFL
jgi:Ca-activated chloride channel family protein